MIYEYILNWENLPTLTTTETIESSSRDEADSLLQDKLQKQIQQITNYISEVTMYPTEHEND
jgi:hypothetical protein